MAQDMDATESVAYLGFSAGKGRKEERRGESEDTEAFSVPIVKELAFTTCNKSS